MSWLLAFVGFALLIILHEFGHFMAAKAVGMRVERFSLFFPPLLLRKQVGETEYAVGAIPFGGYVKITGMNPDEDLPDEVRTRAYYAQKPWKRIVVIAAGPAMNFLIAFLLLFAFFWVIGAETATDRVGQIQKDYPAETQLEPGDRLITVDGKRGEPTVLSEQIQTHRCAGEPTDGCKATTPATLTIERDGRVREVEMTPIYDGELDRTRLGFSYAGGGPRETLPFGQSADVSLDTFWFITRETIKLPARILDAEKRREISGVVGSYEVTRQTILDDTADAIRILAIISLSLAVVNLFPFLPLDGGHIFWAIIEKLRGGRATPIHVMERASFVGFALVFMLFFIGLSNDIDRLQNEGFNVR